jgi:hypothetical protein
VLSLAICSRAMAGVTPGTWMRRLRRWRRRRSSPADPPPVRRACRGTGAVVPLLLGGGRRVAPVDVGLWSAPPGGSPSHTRRMSTWGRCRRQRHRRRTANADARPVMPRRSQPRPRAHGPRGLKAVEMTVTGSEAQAAATSPSTGGLARSMAVRRGRPARKRASFVQGIHGSKSGQRVAPRRPRPDRNGASHATRRPGPRDATEGAGAAHPSAWLHQPVGDCRGLGR